MIPTVYVAGPMTGLPDFNYPAFNAAADAWRKAGWTVVNPAEAFNGDQSRPYRDYVVHDLEVIQGCTAMAMLTGWDGKGARGSVWEREVAAMLGLTIYDAEKPVTPPAERSPETVLEEAQRLVYSDRQASYGHPIDDFTRTAAMWSGLFADKMSEPFAPEDVALAMICVKLSRERNRAKRDNAADIAGYAATLHMVRERQGKTT